MQSPYLQLDKDNIHEFSDLYIAVFNAAPWRDGWSKEAVRERFDSFACYPTFFGLGYFTKGSSAALAFGWSERWVNNWLFHLKEMCVAPTAQRQGLGAKVLTELEIRLCHRGVARVFLETGQSVPAKTFYERQGYKQLSLVSLAKQIEA